MKQVTKKFLSSYIFSSKNEKLHLDNYSLSELFIDLKSLRLLGLFKHQFFSQNNSKRISQNPQLNKELLIEDIRYLNQINVIKKLTEKGLERKLNFVFLKGIALKIFYKNNFLRYSRDIDILVHQTDIKLAYSVAKEIGFHYYDRLVSDSSEGSKSFARHLPKMINEDGVILEIHHRVTEMSYSKNCSISNEILKKPRSVVIDDCKVQVPNDEAMIAHLIYHAFSQKNIDIGPIVFIDLYQIYKGNSFFKKINSLAIDLPYSYEYLRVIKKFKKILGGDLSDKNFETKSSNLYSKNILKKSLNRLKNIFEEVSYYRQIPKNSFRMFLEVPKYIFKLTKRFILNKF